MRCLVLSFSYNCTHILLKQINISTPVYRLFLFLYWSRSKWTSLLVTSVAFSLTLAMFFTFSIALLFLLIKKKFYYFYLHFECKKQNFNLALKNTNKLYFLYSHFERKKQNINLAFTLIKNCLNLLWLRHNEE